MAESLNGMISDEGVGGKWAPDFHKKYPHIRDWIRPHHNLKPYPYTLISFLLKEEKRMVPNPLKKFWK